MRILNMCTSARNRLVRLLTVLFAVALFLSCAPGLRAQMVDLNGNGMSDIWELLYGASGLNPSADTDDDGMSNLQEAIAGTNPFDPNSVAKITTVSSTPT